MKGGLERWTEKLGSAVQALSAQAVSGASVIGKRLQQEALGAQCLLDYSVAQQPSATGGPGGVWKIYTARSKKEGESWVHRSALRVGTLPPLCPRFLLPTASSEHRTSALAGSPHPVVSAWVLDKRELVQAEEHGGSGFGHGGGSTLKLTRPSERRLEQFLEQCRHDVQALARLKRRPPRSRADALSVGCRSFMPSIVGSAPCTTMQALGLLDSWGLPVGCKPPRGGPCRRLQRPALPALPTADPCVLRLIAPLEETRTQLVFITEAVFASVSDLLGGAGAAPGAPALPPQLASERRQLRLSGEARWAGSDGGGCSRTGHAAAVGRCAAPSSGCCGMPWRLPAAGGLAGACAHRALPRPLSSMRRPLPGRAAAPPALPCRAGAEARPAAGGGWPALLALRGRAGAPRHRPHEHHHHAGW